MHQGSPRAVSVLIARLRPLQIRDDSSLTTISDDGDAEQAPSTVVGGPKGAMSQNLAEGV